MGFVPFVPEKSPDPFQNHSSLTFYLHCRHSQFRLSRNQNMETMELSQSWSWAIIGALHPSGGGVPRQKNGNPFGK
jgi:hypothetical protein